MNLAKTKMALYGALMISFYLIPFLIRDTGSAMLILLIVMPLIVWILSMINCRINGFSLGFSLMVGVLFFPSIFLHYNESAWVYIFGYAAISLAGQGIALLTKRK